MRRRWWILLVDFQIHNLFRGIGAEAAYECALMMAEAERGLLFVLLQS